MTLQIEETRSADSTGAIPQQARRIGASRSLGRVDVHRDPRAAEPAWAELEALCPASIYQTRRFLLPWIDANAGPRSLTPMIVVAHDTTGEPVALLPFGITRRGPVSVAEFLGGVDSNANFGLYRPGVPFSPADLESLLRAAAAKALPKPDLFLLINQPVQIEGDPNPLDIFPHQPSASFCHAGSLDPVPQTFMASRLSKDTAKKLRKKRQRLETMGTLRLLTGRSPAAAARILDVFYEHKLERFRRKHIKSGFDRSESRSFLERACCADTGENRPAVELYALTLGDRIIATYGGGVHRGHLHLMFNAFDPDETIARCSPGDILLQMILEAGCSEGLAGFDLGIGEARYKSTWCDRAEPLFDSVLAISPLGSAFSRVESLRRHAKRAIKQSEWAWPIAQRLMRRG